MKKVKSSNRFRKRGNEMKKADIKVLLKKKQRYIKMFEEWIKLPLEELELITDKMSNTDTIAYRDAVNYVKNGLKPIDDSVIDVVTTPA